MLWEFVKRLPRFWIWSLAFFFGLWIHLADRLAYRLFLKGRTEYVRRGHCAQTGQCCRNLALQVPHFLAKRPKLVKLFNAWHRTIFNFHYLGMINDNWLVYECHYLKENTCSIYPYRPKLCREFPQRSLFGRSNLHKGCGFWFVQRANLGTFQEKLAEQEHARERREYQHKVKEEIT